MNVPGPMADRSVYRTHEVRGVAEGGAVSAVDLKTGELRIPAQDVTYAEAQRRRSMVAGGLPEMS